MRADTRGITPAERFAEARRRAATPGSVVLAAFAEQRKQQRAAREVRRFEAARQTRLTYGWTTSNTAFNADLRMDLDALRARARDLVANNDYARKFLAMAVSNIVGPNGFSFQSRAAKPDGTPDNADQDAIETSLAGWCEAGECDVTGKNSLVDICRTVVRALAGDGEALVRRIKSRKFAYGLRLQLLDIDRLDVRYNVDLPSGNRVVMSVELDVFGRPVAYWLLTQHPGDPLRHAQKTQERERIPAAEIFHLFVSERPEQVRGLPWMHTAMLRLQMLAGYEEAAIVAARTGASKMGFFVSPDGTAQGIADGQTEDGQFVTDAEAGAFQVLPEGYDFKAWSPEYPTQNYDSFVKATLRGIASGLNVAYNTLANDLEGVNFSSIRSGTLEERDQWMLLQGWLIGAFLRPLFNDWIETALLSGAIVSFGTPLPASRLQKFRAHQWQGRRWQWVDPVKDVEASLMAIRAGLQSPYAVAGQMGLDLDEVMADLARANAAAEAAGLPAYATKAPPPAPAAPPPDPPEDASKTLMLAMSRALLEARESTTEIHNHIAPPSVTVAPAEVRNEINLPPSEVRVDVAAPSVTVESPAVEVTVEAVLPEHPAPQVDVHVEAVMPDEIRAAIVSLPERVTTSNVERDGNGNIVKTTQIENDVNQQ